MATCGHCDQKVSGIKDHIRAAHGYMFYKMGPDSRYYGYEYLKEKGLLKPEEFVPEWDHVLEKGRIRNAVHNRRRQSKV